MKIFLPGMILFFLLYGSLVSAQPIPRDSLYLGQTPPGNIPQIFNLSVNTGSFAAERIAISNDNREIYYSEVQGYYPTHGDTIKCYRYDGNHWTGPFQLFKGFVSPGLSVTGDTLFFQNNNTTYQTLLAFKTGTNWSNPKRILYNINSAHYFQVTNTGNYYVSSIASPGIGASDWCRLSITTSDTTAVSLGLPLNSIGNDLDLYVPGDESFMITARYSGYATALFISYKKPGNGWTNPKNLGPAINFGLGAWGPYVSADKKYLFYTTGTIPDYSDTHIYWVRVDALIDSLTLTNFVPYVKTPIPGQKATVDQSFNYTIPDTTFIDDDGNNTLTYTAKLNSVNPLPSWLTFDPATRTFSGIPPDAGLFRIKVTATDTANENISSTFNLLVQPVPADSLYLGQTPPVDSAIMFAPGFISLPDRRETKIVFSPNGQECLIGTGANNTFTLLYSDFYNGYWKVPAPATFIPNNRAMEPFFSPDSLHLFFTSYADIYSSAQANRTWSTPVKLVSPVNTAYEEYHPTVTTNGTLYFCSMRDDSKGDIFRSKYENKNYSAVEKLGLPINRHDSLQDGAYDPFIAPDESYLIFTCIRSGGFGQEDQYISFQKNGTWTNPKNLGPSINTAAIEYGSYVSPDNKYYFFSRPSGWGPGSPADIYWIKIDGLIDSLRNSNFVPYVKKGIPDQLDSTGYRVHFTIPDSTFIDDDGNNTLIYNATLTNGNPLPEWLTFDTISGTFSGTPAATGSLNMIVKAKDNAGATVSTPFHLEIKNATSINRTKEPDFRIFPNPSGGIINVCLNLSPNKAALLEIINAVGKTVLTRTFSQRTAVDLSVSPKGIYVIKLSWGNEIIARKVCLE